MSHRQLSSDSDRLERTLRDLQDQVAKLRNGSGNVGSTSFGSLRIGGIEIDEALDTTGPSDHLIVRNPMTSQRVPIIVDGASRLVTNKSSYGAAVGIVLVGIAALTVSVTISAAVAAITDVRLHVTIPSVAASGGIVKVGWMRGVGELARLATVPSGVTVPVAFQYVDHLPGAGSFNYSLGALVSAGSGTIGDGNTIQIGATLVPAAT